mgnify:CR=1 FL=1
MYLDEYKKWLDSTMLSENEKEELRSIANDEKEIENRFYTNLSFGTAGMRGIRGIGKNRMNKYNFNMFYLNYIDHELKRNMSKRKIRDMFYDIVSLLKG